jgi:hypothetical protein
MHRHIVGSPSISVVIVFCTAGWALHLSGCGSDGGEDDAVSEGDLEEGDGDEDAAEGEGEDVPGDPAADGDVPDDAPSDPAADEAEGGDPPMDPMEEDAIEDWDVTDGEERECECWSDEDCDTGNPCVFSECAPVTCACVDRNRSNGTDCSDGTFCNGLEACLDGDCVTASGIPCSENDNPCTTLTCNETTHGCDEAQVADGTGCDDGLWCSGTDTCLGGTCMHEPPCPIATDDPCTYSFCNEPATSCEEPTFPDGTTCTEAEYNPCTFQAECQSGQCVQISTACEDSVPCSEDHCALQGSVCVTVTTCP